MKEELDEGRSGRVGPSTDAFRSGCQTYETGIRFHFPHFNIGPGIRFGIPLHSCEPKNGLDTEGWTLSRRSRTAGTRREARVSIRVLFKKLSAHRDPKHA
jgi:hypothetical protein